VAVSALRRLGTRQGLLVAAGILVRVVLLALLVPTIQAVWFAPFVEQVLREPTLDPWGSWLDQGGDPAAFPYGPLMLAWFSVFGALTVWLPAEWAVQLGMALGVLVAELLMTAMLLRATSSHPGRALVLVAISPVAVYASFVHGQLDIVPTALMFASVLLFRRRSWSQAGVVAGLAVAAKASSLLLPPFALVFLLRNSRYRSGLRPYLLGLLPGLLLFLLPSATSGYRTMVLSTPETRSAVDYAVEVGPGLDLVLLPVVYVALLALLWRYRRANPDIVLTFTGVALLSVALLTPASPGWYVWSVPFLALVAAGTGPRVRAAVVVFWSVVVAVQALSAPGATLRGGSDAPSSVEVSPSAATGPEPLFALLATAAVVTGAVAVAMVLRSALLQYDTYRLSRAPVWVAVAGDSGTGKDTLCISLADVFGASATSFLLGDDYHLYERHAPLWNVTTHLDPAANDLPRLARDTFRLLGGEPVWCRHYDHVRGRFTKFREIAHRELVVVSGLHVLTLGDVRRRVDLTVYTDMDESLRRRLKIERDVGERGHDLLTVQASLERRAPDRERYVLPQQPLADIVLRLEPEVTLPPEDTPLDGNVPLRVVARMRGFTFAERLSRALVGLGGCSSRVEYLDEPGAVEITVSPDRLTSRDVQAVAKHLLERPEELFVGDPVWLGGSRGLMQLVLVLAMLERRRNKLESSVA
jgi:uridine kinase